MLRRLIQTGICAMALSVAAPAFAVDAIAPATPQAHFALAKQYQEQAAVQRKEAQSHRDMAEAYRKANPEPRKGWDAHRNPKVVEMEKHCDAIAKAAEKLATEADKAADFHTLRGKEMQGK